MQVDENMRRAQQRDAVNQAKFYFRREIFTPTSSRATSGAATPDIPGASVASSTNGITNGFHSNHNGRPKQRMMENCFPPLPLPDEGLVGGSVKEEYGEYTMDEIINGRVNSPTLLHFQNPFFFFFWHPLPPPIATSACLLYFFGQGDAFPGLIGLVESYIGTLDLSDSEMRKIASYLDLVRRRANGSSKTAATWIRDFVRSHPSYKFDSAVSKEINYDLVVAVDEM
jgi:glutamate--cysteine ligase catalytic subunit